MSLDNGYIMCECCGERVKLKTPNSNAKYKNKTTRMAEKLNE